MFIKQISVFVENKSGRLAEITEILGKANIDIRTLSVADTTDFGILRLIVDKPDEACRILKEEGLMVSLTTVIAIGIEDKPGAFAKAMAILSSKNMGVEYMYAFISKRDGMAYVIIRVDDNECAAKLLEENGIEVLTEDKVYNM